MNEYKGMNDPTLADVESPIRVTSSSKADWASIDLLPVLWKNILKFLNYVDTLNRARVILLSMRVS